LARRRLPATGLNAVPTSVYAGNERAEGWLLFAVALRPPDAIRRSEGDVAGLRECAAMFPERVGVGIGLDIEAMRGSICRHHRFVGGVGVGGDGFLPMPVVTVSRCS
jgi:hypothetical protein